MDQHDRITETGGSSFAELSDEIQPEAVWQGDSLFVVAPDGKQYPTDIHLEQVPGTGGSSSVRQVRLGMATMWGQPKIRLFPCDASVFGQDGLSVGGLAITRYMVVYFEMVLRNKADSLVFCATTNSDNDLASDTDGVERPAPARPADEQDSDDNSVTLWSPKSSSGSVRCSMSRCKQDRIVVSCLAENHGCVVYVWEQKAAAGGGWGWAVMGTARFILPFDVPRNFSDHLQVQDDAIVIPQADRPDLRITIDLCAATNSTGLTQEIRWTYGDAVWKLCSPPPDEHSVAALASRLDRRVSLLYMDNSLPKLANAWERVIMEACRSHCASLELQPVYIEFSTLIQTASLESILHAIPVGKVFLIVNVRAPASSVMLQEDSRLVSVYVKNFFEQIKNTLDSQDMQCVVMTPHIAADTVHRALASYSSRLLGPYTEMLDDTVSAIIGQGIVSPGREATESYRVIRDHYLRYWEEDEDGQAQRESETAGIPFRLPIPRVRQLLAEAVADASTAPLPIRVAARIAQMGRQGSSEVSAETKQALSNLPLILRGLTRGGDAMYGQDKPIRLTQRHLQAHLLRMDEGRPTFAFFVGANGLGKTTLARQSIREIGGVLEEINCSSLDNAYGYGECTSDKLMQAVETVRMSPNPFKAILLDEVDKNIDMLKALIRLTDSDDDARGLVEHPLAGIFVFITLNVLPDAEQYKGFTGESDPQAKMEKLRDLIVASVKDLVTDTKVIHAIISRLVPYLVFFDDLSATDSRGRHYVASLVEDEIQDFSKRHGTRIIIDEDTLPEFIERLSTVTIGGFRSVRSMVRREIESAVGAVLARNEQKLGEDETIVLRESDGELEAIDIGDGGTALYNLANTQYTRISTAIRGSLDRLLETMRLRDGDRFELDSQEVLAVSYRKLSEQHLFAVKGSEASFSYNETDVVGASRDRDAVRELSDAIDTMYSGMEGHCRTLSDSAARGTADEVAGALVVAARQVYRLALPKSVQTDGIANQDNLRKELPQWIRSAWEVYVDAEKRRKVLKENARNALKEFSSEWGRLVEGQDDIAGDVRKVPQIRAQAFREGMELRDTIIERSKESGLSDRTLRHLLDRVIDASLANEKLDDDKVLEDLELSAKEERPMSVHLLQGAAIATLIDKMVRDMLGNEYEVAKRRQSSLEKGSLAF